VREAYGGFSSRLARYQFVVRGSGGNEKEKVVATGVVDSTGQLRLRGSVYADGASMEHAWSQKVEELITNELNPSIRAWMGAVMPMDPPTKATWANARIDLFLSQADAARRCVDGDHFRCLQILELEPVDDPAFVYLTAPQRRLLVIQRGGLIRRADPGQFDRCASGGELTACDALVRMIPSDAVPRPVPPSVRQSFARFALAAGGAGAFDRFASAGPAIRNRIEAASKMSADSVVDQWRAALVDARTTSTALDGRTALSSVFWIGLCACLALRSSRWR
jgi:hypothetical protein